VEITKSGWGFTPKAAIFIVSQATADNSALNGGVFGWGATDGSRQWSFGVSSAHNLATSNTARSQRDNSCLIVPTEAGTAYDFELDGVGDGVGSNPGPISNGWRIDCPTNPAAAAYKLTVLLLAGSDLSVYVDCIQGPNTITPPGNTQDITAPGFEPGAVLGSCIFRPNFGRFGHGRIALGFVSNGDSVVQKSVGWWSEDNVGTTVLEEEVRSDYICKMVDTGSTDTSIKLEDFDPSGFSATWEGHVGEADARFGYVALKFGDGRSTCVDIIDTKTSTGTQAYTGVGCTPALLFLIGTMCDSVDVEEAAGPQSGTFGLGIALAADDEYSHSIQDEDAAVTSDTQSMTDNVVMNLPQDDGTAGIVANLDSIEADGFTLDFTTADGTARKWVSLVIGTAPAAETIMPQMMAHEAG
jgi:hypothetical protein